LIHLSALSRRVLSAETHALRQKLDVPRRVRDSLRESPLKWLVGSMASGLVTSSLFRRKKKKEEIPHKRRGLTLTLLGLGFSALQPIARIWLTNQLKDYLSKQQLSINPRSPQHGSTRR